MREGRTPPREMPLARRPVSAGRCVRKHLRVVVRPSLSTVGVISVVLALGCSGCGGGGARPASASEHHHSPAAWRPGVRAGFTTDVCTTAGRAAVARDVGVSPSAVRMRRAEASTAAPECIYHAGSLVLSVSVNGSPQPFAVIDRQDVETSQYWGEKRLTPAPEPVPHEGAEAFWFPGTTQLLTTEGINLITATVIRWPHVSRRRWREASVAAARPYLGRIDKALLRGPAP